MSDIDKEILSIKKKDLLHLKEYCWESSGDITEDIDWCVGQIIDQFDGGEFPGTIRITVEYFPKEVW